MPYLVALLSLACRTPEEGAFGSRVDDSGAAAGDSAVDTGLLAPSVGNLLGDLRGKNVVLVHVDTLRGTVASTTRCPTSDDVPGRWSTGSWTRRAGPPRARPRS